VGKGIAIWLFIVLNILDVAITYLGLRAGLPEGNVLTAMVLARYGEWSMYGLKAAVIVLVVGGLMRFGRHHIGLRKGLVVINGMMVLVVASNAAQVVWR